MAAPNYTTDLITIFDGESLTGITALNLGGGGGGAPALGADFAMQGINCVDRPVSNTERGIMYTAADAEFGGKVLDRVARGTQTGPQGNNVVFENDALWFWIFNATPGVTSNINAKGVSVLIADVDDGAFVQYLLEGSDTYGATGRVARCYPICYNSADRGNFSNVEDGLLGKRASIGLFGTAFLDRYENPNFLGAVMKTTAAVKGSNLGFDAIRAGKGGWITAGEALDKATFGGFSNTNDAIANRWGILTSVSGALELQGRLSIGEDSTQTPVVTNFEDADVTILFVDARQCTWNFTVIHLTTAGSDIIWNNITLTALGVLTRGKVLVDASNPTFTANGGTWTGIGETVLQSNSTISGLSFKGCNAVTQNGGSITNCVFENTTSNTAVYASDLSLVTNNSYTSDGGSHALSIAKGAAGTYLAGQGTGVIAFENAFDQPRWYKPASSNPDYTYIVHKLTPGKDRMLIAFLNTKFSPTSGYTFAGKHKITYGFVEMNLLRANTDLETEFGANEDHFTIAYLLESELAALGDGEHKMNSNYDAYGSLGTLRAQGIDVQLLSNVLQEPPEITNQSGSLTVIPFQSTATPSKANAMVFQPWTAVLPAGELPSATSTTGTNINEDVYVASDSRIWLGGLDYKIGTTANIPVTIKNTFSRAPVEYSSRTLTVYPAGDFDSGTPVVITWDSQATGYATVDGSTGNETIRLLDTGGDFTINVASGASVPSVRTSGATYTVVSGAILTIQLNQTGCDIVILEAGTDTVITSVDQFVGTEFDYAYSVNQNIDIGIIKQGFVVNYIYGFALTGIDTLLPIALRADRNYL